MNVVLLPVIAPVLASPALLFLSARWRRVLLVLYLLMMILVAAYILSGVELGERALFTTTFMQESGMAPLYFAEHPYGKIAAFGFLLVGALAILYGLDVSKASEQASALVAIGSAVGIAFSGNFITMFIFWELLTVSTAFLIILNRVPHSIRMGYTFLLIHLAGGLLLFMGIMQHYAATGSLLVGIPEAGLPFFILGIGFKAVFLPLHIWLPMGYPAASFASSVVLAGLTTKVGVFAVARILPPHELIVLMGGLMAIFGAALAFLQSDMRRLLSYSIMSKVGYMVAGAGVANSLAVDGTLFLLVNHMLYKALLFMSVGAIIYTAGIENMQKLEEKSINLPPVWLTLPAAHIGGLVGSLAIVGTPYFNGYTGTYLLKKGTYGTPLEWMLIVSGIITALVFSKFVYFVFIKGKARFYKETTSTMKAAMLLVSAACLLFGIKPQLLAALLPYDSSLDVISLSGAWAALQPVLIGIVLFALTTRFIDGRIQLPEWLSLENLVYRPLLKVAYNAYIHAGTAVEKAVDGVIVKGIYPLGVASQNVAKWDDSLVFRFFHPALNKMMRFSYAAAKFDNLAVPKFFRPIIQAMTSFARACAHFDEKTLTRMAKRVGEYTNYVRDGIYGAWLSVMKALERSWIMIARQIFFSIIRADFDTKDKKSLHRFSMMNLDVNFLIIIIILGVALTTGFLVLFL